MTICDRLGVKRQVSLYLLPSVLSCQALLKWSHFLSASEVVILMLSLLVMVVCMACCVILKRNAVKVETSHARDS